MKNTGLSVDFKKGIITVSADFREKASVFNSTEFKELRQATTDYSDFTVKYAPKKKENKVAHKGLSIPFMEKYINSHSDGSKVIADFSKMKKTYKGHPAYYPTMKQWFLEQFPEMTAGAKKARLDVLTMDFIDDYINNHDDCDMLIPAYKKIKDLYKASPNSDSKVKQWFVKVFPDLTAEDIVMEMTAEANAIRFVDEYRAKDDNIDPAS